MGAKRRRGSRLRTNRRSDTGSRSASGIRRLLALYPKDIDPSGGMLRVLRGKGDKARTAPLPTRRRGRRPLARLPEAAPAHRTTSALLHAKGRAALGQLRADALQATRGEGGCEKRVHPHGFRHGWAVGQVESGISLPVIQQLLGHSSLATTATYVSHIAPGRRCWPRIAARCRGHGTARSRCRLWNVLSVAKHAI